MSLKRRLYQCGYRECQKSWPSPQQAEMCEAFHRFEGDRP